MQTGHLMRHLLWIERSCDSESALRALRRNAFLILAPFIVATTLTLIWFAIFWRRDWYCSLDAAQQHGAVLEGLFVLFAIPAGLTFLRSWDRYDKMSDYVWLGNKIEFMKIRNRAIPAKVHIAFAGMSLPALILVMLKGYPTVGSGVLAVFVSSFALTMYYLITLQLQHPSTSAWFNTEAPKDWLTDCPKKYLISIGAITLPAENGTQQEEREVA